MVETPIHPQIACRMHAGLVAKPGQGHDSRHNHPSASRGLVKVSARKSLNSGPQRRLADQEAARFNAVTNRNYILLTGDDASGKPPKRFFVSPSGSETGTAHGAIARLDDSCIIVVAKNGVTTIVAQATSNRRTSKRMPRDARIDLRANRVGARGASAGGFAGAMLRVSGERTYHADV